MLFARLLETQRAAEATATMLEGAGVSALAHALLIGGWVYLSRDIEPVRPQPAEVFTPVEYLIPKDRLAGLRPQRETVTWTTLAMRTGEGFEQPKADARRDEPRMEMVVPAGKTEDTDAAAKAQEEQPPIQLGDSIMTELQVDSAVVRFENSAAPSYPESMLKRRIEGSVIVQYVVDTLGPRGHADLSRHCRDARRLCASREKHAALHAVPACDHGEPPRAAARAATVFVPDHGHDIGPHQAARWRTAAARLAVAFGDQFPVRGPALRLTAREVAQVLNELCAEVSIALQRM
jgi:hypothetical protein